jgi:hypothetical protein
MCVTDKVTTDKQTNNKSHFVGSSFKCITLQLVWSHGIQRFFCHAYKRVPLYRVLSPYISIQTLNSLWSSTNFAIVYLSKKIPFDLYHPTGFLTKFCLRTYHSALYNLPPPFLVYWFHYPTTTLNRQYKLCISWFRLPVLSVLPNITVKCLFHSVNTSLS